MLGGIFRPCIALLGVQGNFTLDCPVYMAKIYAWKSPGFAPAVDSALTRKMQEYSCENVLYL
jgi:hypothetical protein